MRTLRRRIALAVGTLAVALSGLVSGAAAQGHATASVPKASWYWTMAVSPSNENDLVLATSNGLYRSANGGKSWQRVGPQDFNATSVVNTGSSWLAAGVRQQPGATAVLTTHGDYIVAPGPSVLFEGDAAGTSWHSVHPAGLGSGDVQALTGDPASPQSLVAVMSSGRVYRSADGGKSFKLISPRVGGPPWAVAVTEGGLVAGNMRTGSYTSVNGTTWKRTSFTDSKGSRMVMEYAVQPGKAAHVLMTAYGVVASDDGGATWHPSLRSKVMFGPAAFAPGTPTVAYAVGFDRSLWRTDDAGVSWKQVK